MSALCTSPSMLLTSLLEATVTHLYCWPTNTGSTYSTAHSQQPPYWNTSSYQLLALHWLVELYCYHSIKQTVSDVTTVTKVVSEPSVPCSRYSQTRVTIPQHLSGAVETSPIMSDEKRNHLDGFYAIQMILDEYRTLTGRCVTIDPDGVLISEGEKPVTSVASLADRFYTLEMRVSDIRQTTSEFQKKLDHTLRQLYLDDTPWGDIRDMRDMLEEVLDINMKTSASKLLPSTSPVPQSPSPTTVTASLKTTPPTQKQKKNGSNPAIRCYRCRKASHKVETCHAGPPRNPCPKCQMGNHWLYDCPHAVHPEKM